MSLNILFPAFNADFVSGLEFFGGLLLIVGFASRFTGLAAGIQHARSVLDSGS